ncbi:hypothetical protein BH09PSE1_BH09PSE1_10380 [soil metagenome]
MGRYVFKLPDVGEGTAEAELVVWHVKVGDAVEEDQLLAEVMTDKATVELTSPVAGVVLVLHGEPGAQAPVGGPLVEFEVQGAGNASAAEAAPVESEVIVPFATVSEPVRVAEPAEAETTEAETVASETVEPEAVEAISVADTTPSSGGIYVFRRPDVGEGTAEAELVAWHVAVGDAVEEDRLLAEVMTDKATVELTSPVSGVVVALHGEPGTQSPVGGPLVTFGVEGAGNVAAAPAPVAEAAPPVKASEPTPTPTTAPAPKAEVKAVAAPAVASAAAAAIARVAQTPGVRPLASPAVRNRARDLGVNLAVVPGSGPAGRIGHDDLDAFIAHGATPPSVHGSYAAVRVQRTEVEDVKIIGLRRKIAEKMQEAKRRIPHFMYAEEVDVTELEALRVHLNAVNKGGEKPKLTLLPFIAMAMLKVLPEHPQINSTYDDDAGVLHRHAGVHLGIAAQTPNGLMVPVVRHAEAMDIYEISNEIARVSTAAKTGKATKDELSGSTITITSLGPLGGVVHTPVINHPEVAIVGPNKIIERVVSQNGQFVVRKMMNISSSFDHRIVDGYEAAEFIQKIKALLEHPAVLFMD